MGMIIGYDVVLTHFCSNGDKKFKPITFSKFFLIICKFLYLQI